MSIEIKTQGTSDENIMEFVVNQTISQEEVKYESSETAQRSPIARKIFGFPWTAEVVVGSSSVTIQKQDWVEWDIISAPLSGLLKEHFESQEGPIEENPPLPEKLEKGDLNSPLAIKIKKVIDEELNPYIASHGGTVELVDVKDDVVYVELQGGCQGCSGAIATLKNGIEENIKASCPEVKEVVDITDHSLGNNPYM